MTTKQLLIAGLILLAPLGTFAQGKGNGNGNGNGKYKHKKTKVVRTVKHNGRKGGGPPPWAPAHGYRAKQHVYFPDYYTFYDPNRNGYVYWNNDNWLFSQVLPAFLSSVDLGTARMQVLSDVPLTTRPETRYTVYRERYPAQQVAVVVPVPR